MVISNLCKIYLLNSENSNNNISATVSRALFFSFDEISNHYRDLFRDAGAIGF